MHRQVLRSECVFGVIEREPLSESLRHTQCAIPQVQHHPCAPAAIIGCPKLYSLMLAIHREDITAVDLEMECRIICPHQCSHAAIADRHPGLTS